MVTASINLKGSTTKEVLELLASISEMLNSGDWQLSVEHSVDLVHNGGEASLTIVNSAEEYHGAKINCCG